MDNTTFALSGKSSLSYESASQAYSSTNSKYDLANVVGINLSTNYPVVSHYGFINQDNNEFQVQIYWSAPADSQLATNGPINGVTFQKLTGQMQADNSNWGVSPLYNYDNGINMTNVSQPSGQSTTGSEVYTQLGLAGAAYAASFIPVYGFIIGGALMMVSDYYTIDGMLQTSSHPAYAGGPGNSAAGGWQQLENYSGTSISGSSNYAYEDEFMGTTGTQLQVNGFTVGSTQMNSIESSINTLYLNATNQFAGWNSQFGQYTANAASVSYGIQIVPSVSIGGWVDYGAGPIGGANVTLSQYYNGAYNNFVVHTDSNGYWHFFARPGATYTLDASYTNPLGTSSIGNYDIGSLPAAGSNYTINSGDPLVLPSGKVTGEVYDASNNYPISGAQLSLGDSAGAISTSTNGQGYYTFYFPVSNTYTIEVSASNFNGQEQSFNFATGSSYTQNFGLTPVSSGGGGGGSGCVLYGTLVYLADGMKVPVQYLSVGEKLLSYDILQTSLSTISLTTGTIQSITITNVTQIVNINNGLLFVSGMTHQPLYAITQSGVAMPVMLGNLTTGMKLYDAINNSYIPIANLTVLIGHFTVYDIVTSSAFATSNPQANNYLTGVGVPMILKKP